MSAILTEVAAAAVAGAQEKLRKDLEWHGGEPSVVCTITWRNTAGNDLVVASAIPEGCDRDLLAKSLRLSAEEAEGA